MLRLTRQCFRLAPGFALLVIVPAAANARVISPDITVDLSASTIADESAAVDTTATAELPIGLPGDLPASTDVDAWARDEATGDLLFSIDTTVELPGGVVLQPNSVARLAGATYSIEFDGDAELPPGVLVDAVDIRANGDLVLSFDTTVLWDTVVFEDEDLALWNGITATLFLDLSAAGAATELDLDGVDVDVGGGCCLIHISFDGSGRVAAIDFDDEDILSFDTTGGTWGLVYDGSAAHASLTAADVNALPEPALPWALVAGGTLIALLGRRRGSSRTG